MPKLFSLFALLTSLNFCIAAPSSNVLAKRGIKPIDVDHVQADCGGEKYYPKDFRLAAEGYAEARQNPNQPEYVAGFFRPVEGIPSNRYKGVSGDFIYWPLLHGKKYPQAPTSNKFALISVQKGIVVDVVYILDRTIAKRCIVVSIESDSDDDDKGSSHDTESNSRAPPSQSSRSSSYQEFPSYGGGQSYGGSQSQGYDCSGGQCVPRQYQGGDCYGGQCYPQQTQGYDCSGGQCVPRQYQGGDCYGGQCYPQQTQDDDCSGGQCGSRRGGLFGFLG